MLESSLQFSFALFCSSPSSHDLHVLATKSFVEDAEIDDVDQQNRVSFSWLLEIVLPSRSKEFKRKRQQQIIIVSRSSRRRGRARDGRGSFGDYQKISQQEESQIKKEESKVNKTEEDQEEFVQDLV